MRCEEARERITAYFDRTLPATEAEEVRAHLSACPECSAALDETRAVVNLLGAWAVDAIPAESASALAARAAAPLAPASPRSRRGFAWAAAGVAAAFLGFAAGILFHERMIPSAPATVSAALDLHSDLHAFPVDPSLLERR